MSFLFLIQKSWDQRPFAGFPRLIAGYRVFRRLSMPRHPPCTLSSLTTFIDHRHTPGLARHVRTIDNGSDRQKRCSTTLRPKRKRPGAKGRNPRLRNTSRRIAVSVEIAGRGIRIARRISQNLLLNLVFTCQRARKAPSAAKQNATRGGLQRA